MSSGRESHRETGKARDLVARAKYEGELEDHVALLRSGGHNLPDPELELLEPLLSGARVVQLQCSHGLDALGLLNAGAGSVLHPLDALWERQSEDLRLRPRAGCFDETPAEAEGCPGGIVKRELGSSGPRMRERHWRPGQVIEALLQEGLALELFREYPVLYRDQFPRWPEELKRRLPHSYAVLARRPGGEASGGRGA